MLIVVRRMRDAKRVTAFRELRLSWGAVGFHVLPFALLLEPVIVMRNAICKGAVFLRFARQFAQIATGATREKHCHLIDCHFPNFIISASPPDFLFLVHLFFSPSASMMVGSTAVMSAKCSYASNHVVCVPVCGNCSFRASAFSRNSRSNASASISRPCAGTETREHPATRPFNSVCSSVGVEGSAIPSNSFFAPQFGQWRRTMPMSASDRIRRQWGHLTRCAPLQARGRYSHLSTNTLLPPSIRL